MIFSVSFLGLGVGLSALLWWMRNHASRERVAPRRPAPPADECDLQLEQLEMMQALRRQMAAAREKSGPERK